MHGSSIALIEADRDREKVRMDYVALDEITKKFSMNLVHRIGKNHARMGIIMSNQSKWITSAIGLFYTGGTLVPLDYKLTPEDQLKLIRHSQIEALVTEFPFWKRMKTADTDGILEKIHVFVTEAPEKESFSGKTYRWESMDASNGDFALIPSTRETVACIVYSSGTGGTPKGCMLTHNNYLSQAQSLSELYPIDQDDTYFSFIPTNHAIDFMCGFLLPLFFGSKIVHQRTLRPEFFASTIQTYKISHMALVPMLLKTLEEKIRTKLKELPPFKKFITNALISINAAVTRKKPWYGFSRTLLAPIHKTFGGHLRLIFAGGAFVEASTAQFFYDLGLPVVIGYGLTEAGTVLTVNDLNPFRANTVGKPLKITQLKINNPDNQGIGEVWVQGATVMKAISMPMS
ncbi:MAG: AMP-binding protein [Bdellovibrionota bacterium]